MRSLVAAVAVSLIAPPVVSFQVTRAGSEFRVNTSTAAHETPGLRAMAFDSAGAFVVVWETSGAGDANILGQRYDARGVPLGGEFTVNTYITGVQRSPVMAMDPRGRFVVAWASANQDGADYGIFARRYAEDGAPLGGEFQVNTYTTGRQIPPGIAMDDTGRLVVAWSSNGQDGSSYGVFARRFAADGMPVGGEFQVNSYTTERQVSPSVDVDGEGKFVIVWRSRNQDGDGYGVFGQRFDASGARLDAEFRVNTYTTSSQTFATVAARRDGGFVVVWEGDAQDGDSFGVFAQRFDPTGAPAGLEFRVNQATALRQRFPSVDMNEMGNFVVTWTHGLGGNYEILGRRFLADGTPHNEFLANTFFTADQVASSVAVDDVGNFVVDWASFGQDGAGFGVYAQRFGGLRPVALRVDTAGNGVLEPGETGVSVRPSWVNINGAALTINATLSNPTGPPGGAPVITGIGGNYGTLPDGAVVECTTCYTVSIPPAAPRPAVHWDGTVTERISPSLNPQEKRWTLHVGDSFTDVARSNPFYRFVETLLHHSVTSGCTPTAYCPASSTTREQMAVFVLVAREGTGYIPPACTTPTFADVPAASPFCRWIEELARRGVVGGCGGGNYCPASSVTREQMAVFALRTLDPALSPAACVAGSEMFADVPASSAFCRWVEELARRAVVSGCGGGNYCPIAPVTREQMSVFLSVTFGLTLYGP